MHDAIEQIIEKRSRPPTVSPKRAFALRVDRRKSLIKNMKAGIAGGDDLATMISVGLDRLAADQRMLDVWKALAVDEAATDRFLIAVSDSMSSCARVRELRAVHELIQQRLQELKNAVKVISDYSNCAAASDRFFPKELRGLAPMLHKLADWAETKAGVDLLVLRPMLPFSRKSRADFLQRVHFPYLMIREMLVLFGRPNYQAVADVTNVLFDLPEKNELTASHVRDAWRRREKSGLFEQEKIARMARAVRADTP
jgi:hypothetical protein